MEQPAPVTTTLASAIAESLKANGVKRIFGIPGGGSSLALIEAAGQAGLAFVLTRTETAGAIMAAVTGELTGSPGGMLTGIGPGATSAVNGIAYASLEKSPVILLTDGPASSPHQAIDQNALYGPITKDTGHLRAEDGTAAIERAIATALTPPWGPVQLDLTSGDAASAIPDAPAKPLNTKPGAVSATDIARVSEQLAASRKPIVIAGLEARHGAAPKALQKLADALQCPVLLSMKACGVLAASHPQYGGIFTGAAAEADFIRAADLVLFFGFDAIEIIPGAWPYDCPVAELKLAESTPYPFKANATATGDPGELVDALHGKLQKSAWTPEEISRHRDAMRERFALGGGGTTVQSVIEAAFHHAPERTRLTVDAGAHMFSTLAGWPAQEPFGVLKSDGLSTMGYALPAAIASSLEEPERPVLGVTGDGGLLMCLSELTTAVERGSNITVAVINDAALSLIDIKQQRQQYKPRGVRYPSVDFAACARAMGCTAWRAGPDDDVAAALRAAFETPGPALVDIVCNADGYGEQLLGIRG